MPQGNNKNNKNEELKNTLRVINKGKNDTRLINEINILQEELTELEKQYRYKQRHAQLINKIEED